MADYKDVIHRCFNCGYCQLTPDYSAFNCPIQKRFSLKSYTPGGLLWLIRAWMMGELEWSESIAKALYSCSTCNNCVQSCKFPFNKDIVNIIMGAREEMVGNGLVLPNVARFFRAIEAYGNPYRELRENRGKWAEGIGIQSYHGQEFLLYVGCVGSFDEAGQKSAKALGELLLKAGISFGILGAEEECDGNETCLLGERRIFETLMEKNLSLFDKLSVKKIITLSPHSYNAFKNYYPDKYGVFHYTQILGDLISKGRLNLTAELNAKVTYHDPCFLGRHNSEYEAPRQVLNSIPGVELIEMERNRENSFCCGGGSGNFYTDFFGGGENSPARIRVREAFKTGASILAVACPVCAIMLNEAVKAEGLEENIAVKDISELLNSNT
jgi:Fe-S oxidoreductase